MIKVKIEAYMIQIIGIIPQIIGKKLLTSATKLFRKNSYGAIQK